jgi:hypothetical protein
MTTISFGTATKMTTKMKTKRCSKCNKTRRVKFFNEDPRYRMGIKGWCKSCESDYAKRPEAKRNSRRRWQKYMNKPENRKFKRQRSRDKYWKSPKHCKDLVYRRQYRITLSWFENKVLKQKGRCYLCKRKRRLCPDHDHKRNIYRGAICWPCNTLLGHIEATPGLLKRLNLYLRRR